MKVLLLVLVILILFAWNSSIVSRSKAGDQLTDRVQDNPIHVSIIDGVESTSNVHIRGQVARINSILTFATYWKDVLQDTKADPATPFEPLSYANVTLSNIYS